MPRGSDWLNSYPKDGFGCFENFGGKKVTATRNVLYIQPIIYRNNSVLTESLKSNLKKWLEAQYQPCKVEILPNIFKDVLDQIPLRLLGTQTNCNGEKQYNAIGILNQVIGPIQRAKKDAIGVLSFTDVDLFTKQLSNFCFGYGIPSQGGVQSVHRFTSKFTYESYKTQ